MSQDVESEALKFVGLFVGLPRRIKIKSRSRRQESNP